MSEGTPKGSITFIGQLYTGSVSDKEMVERSGFLKLPFEQGDSVMADKGFTIEDVLSLGVSLNIPLYLECLTRCQLKMSSKHKKSQACASMWKGP